MALVREDGVLPDEGLLVELLRLRSADCHLLKMANRILTLLIWALGVFLEQRMLYLALEIAVPLILVHPSNLVVADLVNLVHKFQFLRIGRIYLDLR